jgi:hypothetical protein
MANIDINSALRESNNKGKLWWHGTSSWHIQSIKDDGLSENVECRAWNCEPGIYFDRDASMAGGMWARNAVTAAANAAVSGKGYPEGKFQDWFLHFMAFQARQGWPMKDDPNFEEEVGIAFKDLKTVEEYQADEKQYLKNWEDIDKILLVMDEDQIPEDCTRKYNGHWKAIPGGTSHEHNKFIKNSDGTNIVEYPYGVNEIPNLTEAEQRSIINEIEAELILNNCRVPTNRFYACNVREAGIFQGMGVGRADTAAIEALDG